MTRSALAKTLGEIVNPICFAVFKLITNFIGCSTGRSAGSVLFECSMLHAPCSLLSYDPIRSEQHRLRNR